MRYTHRYTTGQVLAKVSNWHLCGASDTFTSVAFDHQYGYGLISFVVEFELRAAAGRQVGGIEALEKLNYRVTRNVRWGDGPEVCGPCR